MKKRVCVGEPFDGLSAELCVKPQCDVAVIEAQTNASEGKTRNRLAIGAVTAAFFVLSVAAAIGLFDGSFNETQGVWNVVGPIVGGIFVYYFGGQGKSDGKKK